ncbi:MAG TPA: penicillin-binding transpeptidase domain-containing protein [Candidatus Paceibacterota bacterium]
MISEKYRIKRFENEEIRPEETLFDSLSLHPILELPIGRQVFNFFYISVILIIGFLFLKSFQLQIIDGENYALIAKKNSSLSYSLTPLRGIIFDRNGVPMVENVPVFDVVVANKQLPNSLVDKELLIKRLSESLELGVSELTNLFEENKDIGVSVVARDISKEKIASLKAASLKGVYVVANARRNYPAGPASAHLIGYTAQVSRDDLEKDPFFLINDRVGRLGLEAQYELELRGEHRFIDFLNEESGVDSGEDSYAGNVLMTYIDLPVQKKLYESMVSVFAAGGVRRGAAIIQNPKNGEVLALVSLPSFDSNIFESSFLPDNSKKIEGILKNTDRPLLNRAVSGRYSPGSTIKPFFALAGLKEGIIDESTIIFADGGISIRSDVDPNFFYTFRDWKVHGWTDIKKAIADSVDVYFYALGGGYGPIKEGLGIDRIESYLKGALADQITGIDLPGEIRGFVPSKKWKKEEKGESWYIGDTYNISIGQGDLGLTLAWINGYIGAVANGGHIMKPIIASEVKNSNGEVKQKFESEIKSELPFGAYEIDLVRAGMRQTVTSGTASLLRGIPIPLAAKTGTAQISGRGLNSLLTVFGPFDNPEISMTILVESINESQGLAIRVANDFFSWYYGDYLSMQ